jgi:hypothetical protein
MTIMGENYYEQIARLQQAANESVIADRTNRVNALASETLELWQEATEADREGDHDSALYYSREAGEKTREWQAEMAQLPQQPPQLSERKQRWMQKNPTLVNDPRFPAWADALHNYITGPMMRVKDDSDEYEFLMNMALSPGGDYQADWTADDVVKHLQEHSKVANLGGKFTGADYNRGVNQLINAKRNGYV